MIIRNCRRHLTIPKLVGPQYVTAEEAVKHVQAGDRIYAHSVAQFPYNLKLSIQV